MITRTPLKTVLCYPSQHQGVQSLFTFHKNTGLGAKPPLGIMILAAQMRQAGFDETYCIDAPLDDLSPEQTASRIAGYKPDIVGLTVWTDFWYPAWRTVQEVRRICPDATIVLGGPHCMVYPVQTLRTSGADYLIAGDGEQTLTALAQAIRDNRSPDDLPGLYSRQQDRIVEPSTGIAVVTDVDAIPIPDRTILPYQRYSSILNGHQFESTMVTSRGCPHKCVFCKMHAQKVYARSAEKVVDEFAHLAELGIEDVQVYDDTFTWSPQRVRDICQGILDRNIRVRWAIRDRVNKAAPDMYRLLRRAGCYRIHFGVESGSPPVLSASGKGITLDQAENAIRMARDAGMATMAYFMFGFLDETLPDARATIRFARTLDADYAVFATLIPYPGTKLYDQAIERGIIPRDFWLEYTTDPTPDYIIPHLIEQHMSRKTLIWLKDYALRSYYFRPRQILREVMTLRSWKQFHNKARMAANIAGDSLRSVLGSTAQRGV